MAPPNSILAALPGRSPSTCGTTPSSAWIRPASSTRGWSAPGRAMRSGRRCPASHGGLSVKQVSRPRVVLAFRGGPLAQGGAPVVVGLPTNLTSGGTGGPDHGPASGTGELQEGGTTLSDGVVAPRRTTATPPRTGRARRAGAQPRPVSRLRRPARARLPRG